MSDDPLKSTPRNFQVGNTMVSGIAAERMLYFLRGAAVLAVILTALFFRFLGNHPGIALLSAAAYVVICAIGGYFKLFPRPEHY
jgi:hypothetical protein